MIGSDQIIKTRASNPNAPAATIFPCHGDCERMTRPGRMKLATAEELGFRNTIPRHSKTLCRQCFVKFDPPKHRTVIRTEPPEHKTAATLNALDTYMKARREREASRQSKLVGRR